MTKKPSVAAAPPANPAPVSVLQACAVAAAVAYVYVLSAHPSVPGGDSGELISTSWELGVAHPPGYPTWTVINHIWMRYLFLVGSPAFRTNVFSALAGGAAAGFLFATTATLAGGHAAAGVVAAGLFAFTRLTWMYSIQGEVFALNNLLVAVLLWLVVRFEARRDVATAVQGALMCGLALTNQLTAVLFIVIIAPWVVRQLHTQRLFSFRVAAQLTAAFLLGFSPYLYLPWSAWRNEARLTWGDQRTWRGFVRHILREEYGMFDLVKGETTTNFWLGLFTHFKVFAVETVFVGPVLVLVGLCLFRPHSAPLVTAKRVLIAAALFYLAFFNWRANLNLKNKLLAGVQERFWMQANLVGAILAGLGFVFIAERARIRGLAQMAMSMACVALLAAKNVQNESQNTAVRDFGFELLSNLPQNSILLLLGDLPGNAVRYMQACEGLRPDVRLIDLEMMTFDWYLPMLEKSFPGVSFPAKQKVYKLGPDYLNMSGFLQANIDKFDIFVFENMNKDDSTWNKKFELWHAGLPRAVKRKRTDFDPEEWLERGLKFIGNFPLPDPVKYDDRTWEHVVHEGQLGSSVYFGIFFDELAKKERDSFKRVELRKAALKVYTHIFNISHFEPYRPLFWHKNFGLVAHDLYRDTQDASYLPILREHWTRYIASDANDDQKKAMADVLASLPVPAGEPEQEPALQIES